jgi:lysyl-tRNA synthetase class 2
MPPAPSRWWSPARHRDRRGFLLARNQILRDIRQWFEGQDFLEVETASLQVSPGNETHLHAFKTELIHPDQRRSTLYLHTSPEFACKKLLAAGEKKIFSLAKVWRNGERSALHHPEFTMLEWYRAHAPYTQLMQDSHDLLRLAADATGTERFEFRGRMIDPRLPPELLSLSEAFDQYVGFPLTTCLEDTGLGNRPAMADQARSANIRVADDDTWSDIFSRILVERIEPNIGNGRATILTDYPACEAALARRKPDDIRFCERFEVYACGVELANAFGELTDPVEQRHRFEEEMSEKARLYGESYPLDEEVLEAIGQMPDSAGAALGLDRLVMLASGADKIEQVIWTPVPDPNDRPEPASDQ